MHPRTLRARWINGALIAAGTLLFLAAILAFPFVLQGVAGRDWQTLSDVGQAYGAISAILSGLALCGVAVSVTVQWRQVVWSRTASAREQHFELMKMMLANPGLNYLQREHDDEELYRRRMICNLWVSHWLLLWDLGELDPESLRSAFDELFTNPFSRDWWRKRGPTWIARRSRRREEFMAIAWSSFREADRMAVEIIADPVPD
jgi:hypothetical protein